VRILLLGVSTRALAESAARCGRPLVAVDYFGDRDQKRLVESYALQRDLGLPLTARGLGEAARRVDAGAVVYTANLENHPSIVAKLAEERVLLGNTPEVLSEVRDWRILREFCREANVPCPITLLPGEEWRADAGSRWLCKPIRSGGGHGIRLWDGRALDGSHIVQAQVPGRAASAVFVADGKESRVIGLAEQLVGRSELGASGFVWSGNILPLDLALSDGGLLLRRVEDAVEALTRRFGLRGVNGVDLVVGRDEGGALCPYLLEVNPRYSASMELGERAYGIDVFALHLDGLAGRLPDFSWDQHARDGFVGKGIVYAKGTVTVADTTGWIERGIRDVPFSGQRFEAGHPVCTVFAEGDGRSACLDGLLLRATAVYRETEDQREERLGRTAHPDHRAYA
jgi:predicted ATP-grasp superfamily ATP-dependent carboligase